MDKESRIEQLIQRIIDGSADFPEGGAQSRVEALLVYIITNGTYSEQQILEMLESLKNGIKYIGQVNYYKNLPTIADVGHAYTVKYKGESGTVEDGSEYVWGKYDEVYQWIKIGGEYDEKGAAEAALISAEAYTNTSIQQAIYDSWEAAV